MKLYTEWRNSAGERVRIACNLKRIDYEYGPVKSLAPGEYVGLNPQGLMPALQIQDRIIARSTAILEYLEETCCQRPLLPAEPILRAEVRAFAQLITSDMHPLNNHRVRRYLAADLGATDQAVRGWYHHWMRVGLTALEKLLEHGQTEMPFCFGREPGWADLHLIPQLANARRFECDLSTYPRLRRVEAHCVGLDAFRRARPEAQPDFPGATD